MKIRKFSFLVLLLILALPFAVGCGDKTPGPGNQSPVQTGSTSLTALGLTQPTRVVLAEMFTGDW